MTARILSLAEEKIQRECQEVSVLSACLFGQFGLEKIAATVEVLKNIGLKHYAINICRHAIEIESSLQRLVNDRRIK